MTQPQTPEGGTLAERLDSLRRAVQFGTQNGKRNVIADLDLLKELFDQREAARPVQEVINAKHEMLLRRDEAWTKAIGDVIGFDVALCGSVTPVHMAMMVRATLNAAIDRARRDAASQESR